MAIDLNPKLYDMTELREKDNPNLRELFAESLRQTARTLKAQET